MLRLRLFNKADLQSQIDTRTLDEGEIRIGRDAKADWTVHDPERGISREHLTIACEGGRLSVRDTSSNGVFLGTPRQRIERDRAVPLDRGEPVQFGGFVLVVEEETRAPEPSPPLTSAAASPFDAPGGIDRDPPKPRRAQPFASALKPDPFAADTPVGDGADSWDIRRERAAGEWDAVAPHRRIDHEQLIGSPRKWSAPPPAPVAEAGYGFDAPFSRPILEAPGSDAAAVQIPSDWMEADTAAEALPPVAATQPAPPVADPIIAPLPPAPPQAAAPSPAPAAADSGLFEHFCAGAGLSPTAFAGEDRAAMMERLGAIYRQAMLGVADLMQDRTALKNEYRMLRTTVRPEGNNPFKWVPPQRIAVELLRGEGGGYLDGERALNEALRDIKAHILSMLSGMRNALNATFDALSPDAVERRIASRGYLLKAQRDSAAWTEYVMLAAQLKDEAEDSVDGLINRAFRAGYEAQAEDLGGAR
jgi:type VI secretion system protein ImpI/type VI secretion system protein